VKNNLFHREDEPAIDCEFVKEWWLNRIRYSEDTYNRLINKENQQLAEENTA
jgi:hypothetical protein